MRRLDFIETSTIRLGKEGSLSTWLPTVALLVVCLLPACAATGAPSRLGDYVGREAMREGMAIPPLPERGRRAGLVVIADATAPDAAPVLPDEALRQMAEQLQEQFNQVLPVTIEKIVPAEGIRAGGDGTQFRELGKQHGLDYLIVVVVSGTEQEYPITVFLGWVTHAQPGLRRDNWSLVEVALVDVQNGQVLLHAEGQAWATLDRPTAPGINQWYPVVWRRPLDPNWRWWPPTYEGAPHTLRIIAIHEAVKYLMQNLKEAKRQSELAVVEK